MKKKILVTGGGGFIGSHLVETLIKDGHSVKTIVPYNPDNSWGWIDSFEPNIKKNFTTYVRNNNLSRAGNANSSNIGWFHSR